MALRATRAVFMRGGTSKAVMFHAADLPPNRADWAPIFLGCMGSPDPNGRQLDGMGGGVSSLSKICIIGPPSRSDADVDYTFAQIPITGTDIDYSGNCGNMSSAIGPFAVDEGLVAVPRDGNATVRIHNTNTSKIIVAHFPVVDGRAAVTGDFALDGVAGTAAPIRLDFTDPAGSKTGKLLPTGNVVDLLDVPGLGKIRASLIDAANPGVHLAAADIGLTGLELPHELERNTALVAQLEALRQVAAVAMGFAPDLDAAKRMASIPKVVLLSAPQDSPTLSGQSLPASSIDILARTISVGQPHRAIPLTGALCLAVGCRVPGSVAHSLVRASESSLRIGHPSGVIVVAADTQLRADGSLHVAAASVFRTARRLFQGDVLTAG
ncbi:2-methylaconitate cis-trans isomerase PrpF family protein [Roseiterribacter gracilis]|uniref:Putative methylaconitate Delta-isomerase PrpF n=1 Tax=Roseiterribacter gracilis TaxID=2812848 RepID=A0A8S8XGK9_9PROT|nr:putative methylaconitate Delta-isomerase PrpF [Rhodospirillales bacterium TMPK1]